MPVADHATHPSTVERPDARYQCFNRHPYKDGYYAMNRQYRADGTFHLALEFIPHAMTTDCQTAASGQAATDRKCQGCKHIKGHHGT